MEFYRISVSFDTLINVCLSTIQNSFKYKHAVIHTCCTKYTNETNK